MNVTAPPVLDRITILHRDYAKECGTVLKFAFLYGDYKPYMKKLENDVKLGVQRLLTEYGHMNEGHSDNLLVKPSRAAILRPNHKGYSKVWRITFVSKFAARLYTALVLSKRSNHFGMLISTLEPKKDFASVVGQIFESFALPALAKKSALKFTKLAPDSRHQRRNFLGVTDNMEAKSRARTINSDQSPRISKFDKIKDIVVVPC